MVCRKAKEGVINHRVWCPASITRFSGWVIKEDNRGECSLYLRLLSYFWILNSHFQLFWLWNVKIKKSAQTESGFVLMLYNKDDGNQVKLSYNFIFNGIVDEKSVVLYEEILIKVPDCSDWISQIFIPVSDCFEYAF